MSDEAELEGAYRHLTSPAVTLGNVVAPHVEQTRQRVREAGGAYVVHDTTDFTTGDGSGRARGQLPGPGRLVGGVAQKASSYRPGRGEGARVSTPRENAMRAPGAPSESLDP